jgi:hypothetical protein
MGNRIARYVLTGDAAGKTLRLRDFQFIGGVYTTPPMPENEIEKLDHWFAIQYPAKREDDVQRDVQTDEKSPRIPSDNKPNGEGAPSCDKADDGGQAQPVDDARGLVPEGDGQAPGVAESVIAPVIAPDSQEVVAVAIPKHRGKRWR